MIPTIIVAGMFRKNVHRWSWDLKLHWGALVANSNFTMRGIGFDVVVVVFHYERIMLSMAIVPLALIVLQGLKGASLDLLGTS